MAWNAQFRKSYLLRKNGQMARREGVGKDTGASTSSFSRAEVMKEIARKTMTAMVKRVAGPAEKKAVTAG